MAKVQTQNTSNLSNARTRAHKAILTASTHMTPDARTFQIENFNLFWKKRKRFIPNRISYSIWNLMINAILCCFFLDFFTFSPPYKKFNSVWKCISVIYSVHLVVTFLRIMFVFNKHGVRLTSSQLVVCPRVRALAHHNSIWINLNCSTNF